MQPLIGLLWRLASGSAMAVKMLYQQKERCILKNILSSYDTSHIKASSLVGGDANSNQVPIPLLKADFSGFKLQLSSSLTIGETSKNALG